MADMSMSSGESQLRIRISSSALTDVSSALDAGTSITALVIYLLFGVLFRWDGPRWWGNPSTDSEHCKPGS